MRILYVDINAWHLNPTANLLPVMIQERFPLSVCYGPGFVEGDLIASGIIDFSEKHGPFDAVILGASVPFFNKSYAADAAVVRSMGRHSSHHINAQLLMQFFADVRKNYGKLSIPIKLLSTLNFDYYAATQEQVDTLLEKSISILGPNDQFVVALEDLPDFAKREKHYIKKIDRFSNAWRDFLLGYPEKVITALHFVGPHEFFFDLLSSRTYQIAVPGVEYVLRKEAMKKISRMAYRRAPKNYFNLYRLANRLGLPVFSNPVLIRLYNLLFQRTLAETKCVYTARGGFGIPIRKFFEIPAAGSLLICSPCNGYGDLGFETGRHYLQAEPADLIDVLDSWLNNSASQEVARAGQQLVIAKHSMLARGNQIECCLHAMKAGTYRGARWQAGEFIVEGAKEGVCAA